jgi:hypothetical protein
LAIFLELSLLRKRQSQGMKGHFGARSGERCAFEPTQTHSSKDFQSLCSRLFGILAATKQKSKGEDDLNMAVNQQVLIDPERIESWKKIAAYFGRDERTVKRWEKERSLPIRRVPGDAAVSLPTARN